MEDEAWLRPSIQAGLFSADWNEKDRHCSFIYCKVLSTFWQIAWKVLLRFWLGTQAQASLASSCVLQMMPLQTAPCCWNSWKLLVFAAQRAPRSVSNSGYITTIGVDFRFKTIPVDKKFLGVLSACSTHPCQRLLWQDSTSRLESCCCDWGQSSSRFGTQQVKKDSGRSPVRGWLTAHYEQHTPGAFCVLPQ